MVCAQEPTSSIASPTSQLGRLVLKIIHSSFTAFVHRHAARWTDDGVGGGNGLRQARMGLTDGSEIPRSTELCPEAKHCT